MSPDDFDYKAAWHALAGYLGKGDDGFSLPMDSETVRMGYLFAVEVGLSEAGLGVRRRRPPISG